MNGLIILIPAAICLGLLALATFLWTLRSGQYEDLKGASERILDDEPPARRAEDKPTRRLQGDDKSDRRSGDPL